MRLSHPVTETEIRYDRQWHLRKQPEINAVSPQQLLIETVPCSVFDQSLQYAVPASVGLYCRCSPSVRRDPRFQSPSAARHGWYEHVQVDFQHSLFFQSSLCG